MSTAIKSRDVKIVQIPGKDNNFHAVCSILVTSISGQSVCSLGEAKGHNDDDTSGLLHLAEENGYNNAVAILSDIAIPENDKAVSSPEYSGNSPIEQPIRFKSDNNVASRGGGDNPMSAGQRKFILELCNGNIDNVEKIISQKYGKSLHSLVGWQANDLIRELKSKKFRQ
jgi:hypothetical protein